MKVSFQANRPRASNSARKLRHMSSQTSSSYHRWSRLQQVAGLGYSAGRSRQRAPVLRTQRIPSKTSRLLAQGRPPLGPERSSGRRGSIFDHCRSVKRTLRPRTQKPPARPPRRNSCGGHQHTLSKWVMKPLLGGHDLRPRARSSGVFHSWPIPIGSLDERDRRNSPERVDCCHSRNDGLEADPFLPHGLGSSRVRLHECLHCAGHPIPDVRA